MTMLPLQNSGKVIATWTQDQARMPLDISEPGPPIEIRENDVIQLRVEGGTPLMTLTLGDYEVPLMQQGSDLVTERGMTPFRNMMGYGQFVLDTGITSISLRTFKVLGSKATYERARDYLKYIKDKSDEISNLCFSTSKMSSDPSPASIHIITRKIEAGLNALLALNGHLDRFARDPIFTTATTIALEQYNDRKDIGPEGVDFLLNNPHYLRKSEGYGADIVIGNRGMVIDRIAQRQISENKNVYENQVLVAFLSNFYNFLQEASEALDKTHALGRRQMIRTGQSEYFSIEALMEDLGLVLSAHEPKISRSLELIQKVKGFFDQRFRVQLNHAQNYKPVPTNKVLIRGHYRQAFELIREYYEAGEPKLQGTNTFFGIRSMPKIYELVCLFQILSKILAMGYQPTRSDFVDYFTFNEPVVTRPLNEPNNLYEFAKGESYVQFYYEPSLKLARDSPSTTVPLVDVFHTSATREGQSITYSPDFVITSEQGSERRVHVLDAKYSNLARVKERTAGRFTGSLWTCTHKYVNLCRKIAQDGSLSGSPDSFHVLYSADGTASYESAYGRGLDGLSPRIGAIGLDYRSSQAFSSIIEGILSVE